MIVLHTAFHFDISTKERNLFYLLLFLSLVRRGTLLFKENKRYRIYSAAYFYCMTKEG